ncbi:MAG: hypothetical protein MUF84_08725 [Anaerolineae bacterium]|nr:hypothetical protein [Anaerolineae bacterium]
MTLLHQLHDQMSEEVRLNTRTDTIFVITAIVLNFILLGSSSILAAAAADQLSGSGNATTTAIVLVINFAISIIVNGISIVGLLTGRATRKTLSQGLLRMYEDAQVSQYYHPSLLTNYMRRYVMFIAVIGTLGFASILIPLVVLLTS